MDEMQYLIEGDDTCLYVIYERSILIEKKVEKPSIGDAVKFLWPEDAKNAKKYTGKIIKMSIDEASLIEEMCNLKKKNKLKQAKGKGLKKLKSDVNEKKNLKVGTEQKETRLKNRVKSLVEKSLLSNIETQISSTKMVAKPFFDLDEPKPSTSTANQLDEIQEKENVNTHWMVDEIDSLINQVDSCTAPLTSAQENVHELRNKLTFLKNIISDSGVAKQKLIEKESDVKSALCEVKRRSVSMFSEDEESDNDEKKDGTDSGAAKKDIKTLFDVKRCSVNMVSSSDEESENNEKIDGTETDPEELLSCIKDCSSSSPVKSTLKNKKYLLNSDDEDDVKQSLGSKPKKRVKIAEDEAESDKEYAELNSENEEMEFVHDKVGKWTLKYKQEDKSNKIIELFSGSQIFVSSFALSNTIRHSDRPTILARALMDIVFTEEALLKCTVKGRKANGKGSSEEKKPSLNADGIAAILSYTRQKSKKNGWSLKDDQILLATMRQKLVELRDKKKLNSHRSK